MTISTHWESIDLSDLIPSELLDVVSGVSEAIDVLATVVDAATTAFQLAAELTQLDIDVLRLALNAVTSS